MLISITLKSDAAALPEAKNFDWNSDGIATGHANLAFTYEKRNVFEYNRIRTGLKWSNEKDNVKKASLEQSLATAKQNIDAEKRQTLFFACQTVRICAEKKWKK
jgi:hypothetical protein